VLRRSQVGAEVEVDALPRSAVLRALPEPLQHTCTLAGGDDYELVFTAPPQRAPEVVAAAQAAGVPVTRIGRIREGAGLRLIDCDGRPVADTFSAFDHFKT